MAKRTRKRSRRRARSRRNPGLLSPGTLSNPPRRRRRTRRNPDIIAALMAGVQDAGTILAGEMAANVVAYYIPPLLTAPGADGATKVETSLGTTLRKVIAAAVVGFAAQQFVGADIARAAVAGALLAPLRGTVTPLLPKTGPIAAALSDYVQAYPRRLLSSYPQLSAYPQLSGRTMTTRLGRDPLEADDLVSLSVGEDQVAYSDIFS